ncbi:hypothetical protein OU995_21850 [Roseateles sp. SL47]|uniref:hypothetical protein n=1 Tax=Roseateles sp. SL47 TaxID=2995138 RepID=UPI00226EB806|nr:hypothetical protein [Roseateles sp. SL47]WAC72180.1 hypothetical protein OU995_21850 [Roseateles sp. SL47]
MDLSRVAPGHLRYLHPTRTAGRQAPPLRQGVAVPPLSSLSGHPSGPAAGAGGLVEPASAPLSVAGRAPPELVELCRLPVMQRLLSLARTRQTLLAFEEQLTSDYRSGHPYADAMELARAVYGDPRYEQMINRLKFADAPQCARLLAARIARSEDGLAVRTATAEGFGNEFVLVAPQLAEEITDWHELPPDTVLLDPWGQRQGPARGLLMAAGLPSSVLQIERMFA